MSDLSTILKEITEITTSMETDYPELYKYLDETPITIPAIKHPDINKNIMEDYLDGLKQLLEHYNSTHRDKKPH